MVVRIVSWICLVVAFAPTPPSIFGAEKPETPHLTFVAEYIRELTAIENIRASSEQELKEAKENEKLFNAIHTSTRIQLELRSQIGMLKSMHLNAPYAELIPHLTEFYKLKIDLHQQLIDISTAFIEGPKPGVDYGKLATELPKIRASLEYIDESVFHSTPAVFATLIDLKPDPKGHASHLIITKAEREKLIGNLTDNFGKKLDQKDQNFTVSTASVLKTYLLKNFKSSDEPWE